VVKLVFLFEKNHATPEVRSASSANFEEQSTLGNEACPIQFRPSIETFEKVE